MAEIALVVVDLHQQGRDWVLMWINAQKRHWVPAVGALPPWRTCFMPVLNSDIARNLDKLADLLELEGANPFRIRAYWGAARVVAEPRRSVTAMTAAGEDPTLPGIGRDLSEKIGAVSASRHITVFDETERRTPEGLLALLDVPGVGERTEQRTRQEAQKRPATGPRIRRPVAEDIAKPLLRYVGEIEGTQHAAVDASYRRCKETVGDLDTVVASARSTGIAERFDRYEDVAQILPRGPTRSSVVLRNNGIQVEFRIVSQASYGAALQYFTGSNAHNIALRRTAVARGLKLNGYGLFESKLAREIGVKPVLATDAHNPGRAGLHCVTRWSKRGAAGCILNTLNRDEFRAALRHS
ncbi:MAG: hypothetical protein J2P48_19395 [Alphaproteobacteria bacterium]|nr:hypothetical protein [Alphaproteobacteria bacterium]